ncbi:MAG: DUF5110 domain-containing protein [Prevotella sp.]|nr:DUF5110 domain-containing protein [Prevotella sp.]
MNKKNFLLLIIALMSAWGTVKTYAQNTEVIYYSPNIVRVVKTPTDAKVEHHSWVVTATPQAGNAKNVLVKKDGIGRLTFMDKKGNVLLREGGSAFRPITEGVDKGRYRVIQSFELDEQEPIYGLGMLQNGKMNQRGENRRMMQSNQEDYAHFFQSIKGYGVFWDNYSPTALNDDGRTLKLESEVGELVDYYFIYGGDADGVISGMRWLTGKVPMLPLWTYGFHQSRERYVSSSQLLDVVDTYQKTGVPLDGIIQDWQYWGSNYVWNAMEFGNEEFANYQEMIDRVHQQGKHLNISIWASFGPMTKPYRDLSEKGLLYDFQTWPQSGLTFWPPRMDYPSGVRVYDPFSKVARDIYWRHLSRLHQTGIDAWWMDSTDPDHLDFKESDLDQVRPMTDPVSGKEQQASWRSMRNLFPLATVEGVYNHQRAVDKNKRVFILTRSYFAGQQRTGANTWSGDVNSRWDVLRKQVPLCLNYTLTANPNVNTDIGGFFAGAYNTKGSQSGTKNPQYHELYVRWMQFGLFCPMMRSHGTEVWRELNYYGKPGEPVYDALLSAVKMRYQLLPYIYSTSWQVHQNDDSFMRALMMDFKDDPKTLDNNREFLFGRSLLVAPIVEALYTPEKIQKEVTVDWTAKKTYDVYLPQGTQWYDYWTNERLEGGQTVNADGTLAHCPVYVKAGSILPLCKKEVMNANIADWQTLDMIVYPGADAVFTLYEDEGDNYNYEQGAYSTITLQWNDRKRTLTIGKREGSFKGMLENRTFRIQLPGGDVKTVEYNGSKAEVKF